MYYHITYNDNSSAILENDQDYVRIREEHNWSSISSGYDTREELIKDREIQPEPCCCCGNMYGVHYIEPVRTQLLNKKMCHCCDIWTERAKELPSKTDVMIVGSGYYTLGPERDTGSFRGFGGSKFQFKRLSDGVIVTSTNVWFGGDIPDHLKPWFPDNATRPDLV